MYTFSAKLIFIDNAHGIRTMKLLELLAINKPILFIYSNDELLIGLYSFSPACIYGQE